MHLISCTYLVRHFGFSAKCSATFPKNFHKKHPITQLLEITYWRKNGMYIIHTSPLPSGKKSTDPQLIPEVCWQQQHPSNITRYMIMTQPSRCYRQRRKKYLSTILCLHFVYLTQTEHFKNFQDFYRWQLRETNSFIHIKSQFCIIQQQISIHPYNWEAIKFF
jgi:hypothetical protein